MCTYGRHNLHLHCFGSYILIPDLNISTSFRFLNSSWTIFHTYAKCRKEFYYLPSCHEQFPSWDSKNVFIKIRFCLKHINLSNLANATSFLPFLHSHCVKSVQIRSFFWSVFSRITKYFPQYEVSLRIKSECGKIRTRKNSPFGYISHSE